MRIKLLFVLLSIEASFLHAPPKQNLKSKIAKGSAKDKSKPKEIDHEDELLDAILSSADHQIAVKKVQEQNFAKQHMHQINDLIDAINVNNTSLVQNILKQNPALANVPYDKDTVGLMLAVAIGNQKMVEIFINAHANPNIRDHLDWTPLIVAAQKNFFKIVEMLLNAQADPNLQNKAGQTALLFAAEHNNIDMVQMLLQAGANPNMQRNDGVTALMFAVQNKNLGMTKMLLDAHANPNLQRIGGATSLMFAVLQNNLLLVRLLLEKGADPSLKDNKNWTALKIAKKNGSEEIARILKEVLVENLLQKNEKRKLRNFNQRWQINHENKRKAQIAQQQDMMRKTLEAEEEQERSNIALSFEDEILLAPPQVLDWTADWDPEEFIRVQNLLNRR